MKNSKQNLETLRHSASHVLAQAVLQMFPEAKLAIGPAIENGFYYDFDLPRTLIPEDLGILEKKMQEIIKADLEIKREKLSEEKGLKFLKEIKQPYKLELAKEIEDKEVCFYRQGDFVDLCAGPHVKSTGEIKAFKLLKIAGAYWRGNEKNKMLQRIYGTAFYSEKDLEDYLKQLEEAEKRDHRKLGQQLDLFSFHDAGPGFPFWHSKGMIVRNLLIEYWRAEHKKVGYTEINTPIILREDLWHQSGHWDNYKNNMYFTEIDSEKYAVKPMNCPGGIQIYKNSLHSYKEFPLRVGELGLVHRHELSGVLHGLFRARSFTQDDAHIYCTKDQIQAELKSIIKLVEKVYKQFGFNQYHVELSTRPEKSIGSDEMWEKAEKTMEKVARDLKLKFKINPGDGAFYGPKFDFHIKDSKGRTWQCATIQLDFSMPERFDLEYVAEDGSRKRPAMIHRTVFGSLERFIGILIEHHDGAFPAWLAPVQVIIIPISDKKHLGYAKEVSKKLEENNIRVDVDARPESVGKKIREAELQKIPYMIILGDKEKDVKKISVRSFQKGDLGQQSQEKFLKSIVNEIEDKK